MSGTLDEESIKMDLARSLVAEAFARRQRHRPARMVDDAEARARRQRAMRSARLAASLKDLQLYTMENHEQPHALTTLFHEFLPRIIHVCELMAESTSTDEVIDNKRECCSREILARCTFFGARQWCM
jgi:hypothetical protein